MNFDDSRYLLSFEESNHERLKLVVAFRVHQPEVVEPEFLLRSLVQTRFDHQAQVVFLVVSPVLHGVCDVKFKPAIGVRRCVLRRQELENFFIVVISRFHHVHANRERLFIVEFAEDRVLIQS